MREEGKRLTELNSWVIGLESEDDEAGWWDTGYIALHGEWVRGLGVVCALRTGAATSDNLELVAVQMPWVSGWCLVVDNNFHGLAELDGERIGVFAIDAWIQFEALWCTHCGEERGNLLLKICLSVDQHSRDSQHCVQMFLAQESSLTLECYR